MREQRIELLGKIDDWISEHCEPCTEYVGKCGRYDQNKLSYCNHECDKVSELHEMGDALMKLTRRSESEVVAQVAKKRGRPKQVFEIVEDTKDNINPDHYKVGGIETIDYIQAKLSPEQYKGYLLGNIIKYTSRFQHKNGAEDLKKSKWYMDRLIGVSE